MPKSKHRKMTRNIPHSNPQRLVVEGSTQPATGTTITRAQTTVPAPPVRTVVSSPYGRGSTSKSTTLPPINYVGKELRNIGILTGIIVVVIVVLSFILR
jgi:hypothetical protein